MPNLKVDTIRDFRGYGNNGNKPGEYYFSRNMKSTPEGIANEWYANNVYDTDDNPELNLAAEFAQGKYEGSNGMYWMQEGDSDIYWMTGFGSSEGIVHSPSYIAGSFGGIIVDPKERLIYVGVRYIGIYDGETSNYDDGTVSIANGSNAVVGTGTTFTSDMIGKVFIIDGDNDAYTVSTYTDATGIINWGKGS